MLDFRIARFQQCAAAVLTCRINNYWLLVSNQLRMPVEGFVYAR